MYILEQKFNSISIRLSQKKETEKWLLRTSVQCRHYEGDNKINDIALIKLAKTGYIK